MDTLSSSTRSLYRKPELRPLGNAVVQTHGSTTPGVDDVPLDPTILFNPVAESL